MKIDLEKFYKLVSPRPTIIVSTIDPKGSSNAAPISFVSPVSMEPPLIAFASAPDHDTVKNINKTKDFVVNLPGKKILQKMWICKKKFPYGVSEIKEARLTEQKSAKVKSPKIKECFAKFECKLYKKIKAGDHLLIIGKVVQVDVDPKLFKKGKFQVKKAQGLMHIGSEEFGLVGQVVRAK